MKLQDYNQWVLWKREQRGNKETKIPCGKNGRATSISNTKCWKSFKTATNEWLKDMTGVIAGTGFCLTEADPFICIDLDAINKWYGWREIVRKFNNTYIEWSPSENGLHIWTQGFLPTDENISCKKVGNHDDGGIEIYASKRYMTFTTNPINDNDVEPNQESINWLFGSMNDKQLISKILSSTISAKVQKLFEGKWQEVGYNSHSEGDLALCRILSNANAPIHQIDRIFRKTRLFRPKWEEKRGTETYGQMTLRTATSERRK